MRSWLALVGIVVALGMPGAVAAEEAPPPEGTPVLTVTPNVDLIDLQAVTVSGTGFRPNAFLDVYQCPSTGGRNNCEWGWDYVGADGDGGFSHTFGVAAVILDGYGDEVDCRTAPGACELRIYGRSVSALARVGLNFDADAPRAGPPTLAADPNTGLVDGQEIHVTGSGLRPGGYMFVFVCEGTTWSDAACPNSFSAGDDDRVDANGDLDTQFRVRAVFRASPMVPLGAPAEAARTVDCRVSSCFLSAFEDPFNGSEMPVVPLQFDPDAPLLPTPQLSVDPATDLVDGQTLTIEGTDWFAAEAALVLLCAGDPSGIGECRMGEPGWASAGPDGTFTFPVTADRHFETYRGDVIDCAVTSCAYVGWRLETGDESAAAAIAFRADPTPPGGPAATPTAAQPRFTG